MDLFDIGREENTFKNAPLAYRMRPRGLDEVIGQKAVAPGSVLRKAIEKDHLHSFILFGPPGTGKTSIARIIARTSNSHFEYLSAVSSGVSDIKRTAADAADRLKFYRQRSILFVDEIHRFNKSQQDVLLPFVEDGTLLLIGATTENPLYELNSALLSRMKIYFIEALSPQDISWVITTALLDKERGLGEYDIKIDEESLAWIAANCKGDARMALNIIETVFNSFYEPDSKFGINLELLQKVMARPLVKYDRTGDAHYDSISAFIKSIRGSNPDAALFWLAYMLEGGEDPKFVARRLIVHAAEDIGLADPFALVLAAAAAQSVQFVGLPEARIPLSEATIYLATAPKSNSSLAIDAAISAVRNSKSIRVPDHIADTSHSKASGLLGKGKSYKYPHNYGGYVAQNYLPDDLPNHDFYKPGDNPNEQRIKNFLKNLPGKKY